MLLPELGPGCNVGGLTKHRPRWAGTHETVQSPPDTMLKLKAQTDSVPGKGARAGAGAGAGAGASAEATSFCLSEPVSMGCKSKGAKRCNVTWAPDLTEEFVSDSLSGSIFDPLTHTVTEALKDHAQVTGGEVKGQAAVAAEVPVTGQTRKSSIDPSATRDRERPRRDSAGENRSDMATFHHLHRHLHHHHH